MAQSLWVDPWKEDSFAFCHHHNVSYSHRVNDEGKPRSCAPYSDLVSKLALRSVLHDLHTRVRRSQSVQNSS